MEFECTKFTCGGYPVRTKVEGKIVKNYMADIVEYQLLSEGKIISYDDWWLFGYRLCRCATDEELEDFELWEQEMDCCEIIIDMVDAEDEIEL